LLLTPSLELFTCLSTPTSTTHTSIIGVRVKRAHVGYARGLWCHTAPYSSLRNSIFKICGYTGRQRFFRAWWMNNALPFLLYFR
jgi:hypothetical protein